MLSIYMRNDYGLGLARHIVFWIRASYEAHLRKCLLFLEVDLFRGPSLLIDFKRCYLFFLEWRRYLLGPPISYTSASENHCLFLETLTFSVCLH